MSAGFTPGPWSFHPISNPLIRPCKANGADYLYADYTVGHGEKMVADVRFASGGSGGGYPSVANAKEFVANAHLIAAAPELYAALDAAIAMIEDAEKDTNWVSGDPYGDSAVVGLRAVLAKARGDA